MLRSIGATNFDVELIATVAGADNDGAADEAAEGFKDFLAELLQGGNKFRWNTVINTVLFCGSRTFELTESEVFTQVER